VTVHKNDATSPVL